MYIVCVNSAQKLPMACKNLLVVSAIGILNSYLMLFCCISINVVTGDFM